MKNFKTFVLFDNKCLVGSVAITEASERGQGFKPEFKFDNMAGTRGREKLQKINEDKKLLSEISNL